jgi:radical SAM protein with 4Fe4S-binding SPASM domain
MILAKRHKENLSTGFLVSFFNKNKKMNIMDKYIINPAYIIKKDGNRVILCQREHFDEYIEKAYELQNIFSFIHPLNAQMLSFFNGIDDLNVIKKKISKYFKISLQETNEIILKYIENKETFSTNYNGKNMYFPKNLIIKNSEHIKDYYVYNVEEFVCREAIDLDTMRLNSPLKILMLPTMQCYTDCIYCYANRKMNSSKIMTLPQIISIIKQAKEIGVESVSLNGGEVLLHSHYKEIIENLLANNFEPVISTKVPISKSVIDTLKDIGLNSIQISLDSVNPQTLKQMLCVKESYIELMYKTLQYLSEKGFRIKVHSIVTSYNSSIAEFENLISFLSQFKGVYRMQISPAGYSLYKHNFLKYRPSEEFMNLLSEYIDTIKEKYPDISFNFSSGNLRKDYEKKESKSDNFNKRTVCTGNIKSFVILPDGRVTICEELYEHPQFIIGDLTKQSIMEVWHSKKAKELFYLDQSVIREESRCKKCSTFDNCRQSRGVCWKEILMAYGENNWDYPDTRCPASPEIYNDICLK